MKKTLCSFLIVVLLLTTVGCGSTKTRNDENTSNAEIDNTNSDQTNNTYAYTATLELYPDIMISAKSREALDEVLDILLDAGVSINIDDDKSSNTNDSNNAIDDSTTNNLVTDEDKNAKIELNNTEEKIFNLLKQSLDDFPNPSSVKVVKFHAYQSKEDRYYLTLTSENNFGGNLTDIYTLDSDGAYGSTYSESQLNNMSTILGLTKPSCDISKINKVLEQYCSEQGW